MRITIPIRRMGLLMMFLLGAPFGAQADGNALFRDDFNEDFINEQWEVVNPDPDSAIVEEGFYQVVTQVPEKKLFNAKNMLLYKGELPKEWEAESRVLMTQMNGDCYWSSIPFVGLILKQDDDNAIVLVAGGAGDCGDQDAVVFARVKNGKWEPRFFSKLGRPQQERPVTVKLVRRGRLVEGYFQAKGKNGKTWWYRVGVFPAIHLEKYRLGVIAARGSGKTHEQLEKVDWVELRKPKQ